MTKKNQRTTPLKPRARGAGNISVEAHWRGNQLWFRRRKVAEIVLDGEWPNMWRVKTPDGTVSDMVNRTRARDAARSLAAVFLGINHTQNNPARQIESC